MSWSIQVIITALIIVTQPPPEYISVSIADQYVVLVRADGRGECRMFDGTRTQHVFRLKNYLPEPQNLILGEKLLCQIQDGVEATTLRFYDVPAFSMAKEILIPDAHGVTGGGFDESGDTFATMSSSTFILYWISVGNENVKSIPPAFRSCNGYYAMSSGEIVLVEGPAFAIRSDGSLAWRIEVPGATGDYRVAVDASAALSVVPVRVPNHRELFILSGSSGKIMETVALPDEHAGPWVFGISKSGDRWAIWSNGNLTIGGRKGNGVTVKVLERPERLLFSPNGAKIAVVHRRSPVRGNDPRSIQPIASVLVLDAHTAGCVDEIDLTAATGPEW